MVRRYQRRKVVRRRPYRGRRLVAPAIGSGGTRLAPVRAERVNRGGAPVRMGPGVRVGVDALGRIAGMLATATKRRNGFSDDSPATGSVTSFTHSRSNPDKLGAEITKLLVGPRQYSEQVATKIESTVGRQMPFVAGGFFTKNQIQTIKDLVWGGSNPNRDAKIFFKHVISRFYFKNQNNFPVKMRVYMVKAIRDGPSTAIDSPVEAWSKGYTDESDTSADHSFLIGQTPRMSGEFRRYFQVVKTFYLDLSPGQIHEHKVYYGVNKVMNTTTADNLSSQTLGSWTLFCMPVFHGTLVNEEAVADRVSFSAARIDYAHTTTYHYNYFSPNSARISVGNVFESTLTGLETTVDTNMGTAAPANTG